jgi:anti-anti-sigma regulatory factor
VLPDNDVDIGCGVSFVQQALGPGDELRDVVGGQDAAGDRRDQPGGQLGDQPPVGVHVEIARGGPAGPMPDHVGVVPRHDRSMRTDSPGRDGSPPDRLRPTVSWRRARTGRRTTGEFMSRTIGDGRGSRTHEALFVHPDRRHRTALTAWLDAARRRAEKIVTVAAPAGDFAGADAAVGVDRLRPSLDLGEQVRRAATEGFLGLGFVVWADNVVSATSAGFHDDVVETALHELCSTEPVSVLCLYGRPGVGSERVDMAVAHHADGLYDEQLRLCHHDGTLQLGDEFDGENIDVLRAALDVYAPGAADTVRVDLTDVRYLSASAAHHLLRWAADLHIIGRAVEIDGARPHVLRMLDAVDDLGGLRGPGRDDR